MALTPRQPGQTIGQNIVIATVIPTITATPYSVGDVVGIGPGPGAVDGVLDFTDAFIDGANSGILQAVTIVDEQNNDASFDVFLFDSALVSPDADNIAFAPTITNKLLSLGHVSLTTWKNGIAHVSGLAIPVKSGEAAGTTLYAQLVTRSLTTWAAADLQVRLHIVQD